MNRFIRYWNQNRKQIIITIVIIAFIILIIQLLNNFLKENNANSGNAKAEIDKNKPVESVITGEIVSEKKTDENMNVIDEFMAYCNNKEYQKAFELIGGQCKEEVFYNDINLFVKNYCPKIFANKKIYDAKLWFHKTNSYTYKVTYYSDDILSTGGSNMDNNIEDYITIVKEDGKNKIHINGFIEKNNIKKIKEENNIKVIIENSKIYQNYQSYNIIVKNNTNKTILLTPQNDSKGICVIDEKNTKYPSYIHEIPDVMLILKPGQEQTLNIRFNKMYNMYRNIESIEFSNIILDYELYKNGQEENIPRLKNKYKDLIGDGYGRAK